MKEMGNRLRVLRENAGYTQERFGEAVGVTGAQIYKYEAGVSIVNVIMASKMAEALGISLLEFITRIMGDEVPPLTANHPEEIHDSLNKAAGVLMSGTGYANALRMNIDMFYEAVEKENTIQNFHQEFNALKRRVNDIERTDAPLPTKRPT